MHTPSVSELESTLRDTESLVHYYSEWMAKAFVDEKLLKQQKVIADAHSAIEEINKKAKQAEPYLLHTKNRCAQIRTEILTIKHSKEIEKLKKLIAVVGGTK